MVKLTMASREIAAVRGAAISYANKRNKRKAGNLLNKVKDVMETTRPLSVNAADIMVEAVQLLTHAHYKHLVNTLGVIEPYKVLGYLVMGRLTRETTRVHILQLLVDALNQHTRDFSQAKFYFKAKKAADPITPYTNEVIWPGQEIPNGEAIEITADNLYAIYESAILEEVFDLADMPAKYFQLKLSLKDNGGARNLLPYAAAIANMIDPDILSEPSLDDVMGSILGVIPDGTVWKCYGRIDKAGVAHVWRVNDNPRLTL